MKRFLLAATVLFATACQTTDDGDDQTDLKPLTVSLPVLYRITKGDELTLRVAPQSGVKHTWSTGAQGEAVTVKPDGVSVYTVKAARGSEAATAVTVVVPQ